jgi:hypothetical protein
MPVDESFLEKTHLDNGVLLTPSNKFKAILKDYTNKHTFDMYRDYTSLRSNASYYVLNDYASLGWSLASADLNNDGSDDLLIGAPVYSYTNLYQNGLVFIKLSKNGLPLNDMNLEQEADIKIGSPFSFNSFNHTRFGHAIKVLDLNQDGYNDIVISAPSLNLENIKYQVIFFFLVRRHSLI